MEQTGQPKESFAERVKKRAEARKAKPKEKSEDTSKPDASGDDAAPKPAHAAEEKRPEPAKRMVLCFDCKKPIDRVAMRCPYCTSTTIQGWRVFRYAIGGSIVGGLVCGALGGLFGAGASVVFTFGGMLAGGSIGWKKGNRSK